MGDQQPLVPGPYATVPRPVLEAAFAVEERHRVAREVFEYHAARVQSVTHIPLVFVMMMYPTLLGFCLAFRMGRFNLMAPGPNLNNSPAAAAALGSKKDLWRTDGPGDIPIFVFTLIMIAGLHLFLASYLLIRAPKTGPNLSRRISWFPPLLFWGSTTLYLLYFVKAGRYGPGKYEWVGAGIVSGVILVFTVFMLIRPCVISSVTDNLDGPGGAV